LTAGARRFQWASGVVEPDVDPARKGAADGHVVVLDEEDLANEALILREPVDLLDEPLALLVGRVCLAREHQLDGSVLVTEDRRQAVEIAEDQGRAFVHREASGEPDSQRLVIEEVGRVEKRRLARFVSRELLLKTSSQEPHALPLERASDRPERGGVDGLEA